MVKLENATFQTKKALEKNKKICSIEQMTLAKKQNTTGVEIKTILKSKSTILRKQKAITEKRKSHSFNLKAIEKN
jgi:hypothetical protein